jgi:hypothetical protein
MQAFLVMAKRYRRRAKLINAGRELPSPSAALLVPMPLGKS